MRTRLSLSLSFVSSLTLAACGHDAASAPALSAEQAAPEAEAARGPSPEEIAREADRARQAQRIAAEDARLRAEAEARLRADAEGAAFDRAYPLHGVAFHFLAPLRRGAAASGPTIGYLRRGATFRASARIDGPGCARGWHELPGAGFVCRGEGVILGETPQTFEPSPQPPSLEDALPYPYAFASRDSVAQFLRLPTVEEEGATVALFERMDAALAARDAGVPSAAPTANADAPAAETTPASNEADVEAPPPPGAVAESTDAAEEPGLPSHVRMRMQRGFYVSVDAREETEDGRRFVRTVRGGYVREAALSPNEPPTHRGIVLGGSWTLPIGIVYRSGAHHFTRNPSTGELVDAGPIPQHTSFRIVERLQRGQSRYLVSEEGWVVRDTAARVAELSPRPSGVPEGARYILVDLSEQTLVAYEGERPVFVTTVSTGRAGFETPTGTFKIQSKHVSTTMDDLEPGPESYSIEDVPWTMYFEGSYALHGAFWHNQFGRVRSHGCINLAPADARYVFGWATPTLPASWHGVFATTRNPGTYVVIVP